MVDRFLGFCRALTGWYVAVPLAVAIGLTAGVLVAVEVAPGKPNIGVIDVPFAVITDNSTFVISEYLRYAREDDSIKAVVIKLGSPGGGAAASERLYVETRALREEKPVVLVMNGLVASGGYMMAMGANHTYAQTSSLVGNVGVVAFTGPLIPQAPPDFITVTGPHKLSGGSRRDWTELADQLKQTFAEIVISERGDKLGVSEAELVEGRLYSGLSAVQLGLADEIGGDSDALAKAAELAGINRYELVDVNAEVRREFILKARRVLAAEYDRAAPERHDAPAVVVTNPTGDDPASGGIGLDSGEWTGGIGEWRRLMTADGGGMDQENALPEFPFEVGRPNLYYLYTGHDYTGHDYDYGP